MALITSVGDANSTLFWTDNWLHGKSIAFLPQLFSSDSKRRAKRHTVCEAMVQNSWVLDIQGASSVTALAEYLEVWELIMEVQLRTNTPISTVGVSHVLRVTIQQSRPTKHCLSGQFLLNLVR